MKEIVKLINEYDKTKSVEILKQIENHVLKNLGGTK